MTSIHIAHDNRTLAFELAAKLSADTDAFVRGTTDKMEDTKRGALVLMHRMVTELGEEGMLRLPRQGTRVPEDGVLSNILTDEYIVDIATPDGLKPTSFYTFDDLFEATPSGKTLHAQLASEQAKLKDEGNESNVTTGNRIKRLKDRIKYGRDMYGTAHACFLMIAALADFDKTITMSFDKPTDEYNPKPFFLQDKQDPKNFKVLAAPAFAKLNISKAIDAAGGKEKVTYQHVIATIKRKKKKAPQNAAQAIEAAKIKDIGGFGVAVVSLKDYIQKQDEGAGTESQRFVDRLANPASTETLESMYEIQAYLDIYLSKPELASAHARNVSKRGKVAA